MQKRYPNDEIEEIEKESSGSTWYIVAFIIILLTLGVLGALIVLYGPQLRQWSKL
jgi:Flp pilus assembly protein TadB